VVVQPAELATDKPETVFVLLVGLAVLALAEVVEAVHLLMEFALYPENLLP